MNEIGEKLKEARKVKGYTLDDLQQMTKIQKRYLIAIEEGNYDVMPGKFYARAFIKQYADTVGLNGDQLLEEYTDAVPHAHDEEFVEKVSTGQTRSGKNIENVLLTKFQNNLPTILIGILAVAIVAAIYFAVIKTNNQGDEAMITNNSEAISVSSAESISESESEPTTESAESVDSIEEALGIEIVSSTGSTTTYAVTGNAEDNSLTLTATGGDSWISVEGDGATIDAQLIADGSTLETEIPEGTSSLVIIIGNTPATEINLNGEDVPYAPEAENSVRQEIEFQFE
ncbi:helix-turn-helix domain-containing protein [Carnobacterium pleistocenium]|uniref:helix-turn-helix domain-containing protein n=1 Tax=Carnobacterium pleistocenium TaxID=181073 RepID=UPI00054F1C0E